MSEKSSGVPDQKNRRFVDKLVLLPTGHEVDPASDGITKVDLAIYHVRKCGGAGVYNQRQKMH
jgi:hypothetical protein